MNNLLLNLKFRLNNKFGKIFLLGSIAYTFGYFNMYNYAHSEPNFFNFNFYLLDTGKPLIYFFSFLFLILVYNTLFHQDFNETYILKFSSRWKWLISTYKLIIVEALMFVLLILIISIVLSLPSIDLRNIWTQEYITNSFVELNTNLYNSIINASPLVILILNYINMVLFLSTLGIMFLNLEIIIRRKEIVISIIYGFLLFDNIALYTLKPQWRDLFLFGNARFIDYYLNKPFYETTVYKFSYFIILIIINLLIAKFICKKIDFSKSKKI